VLHSRSAISKKYVLPLLGGVAAILYLVREEILFLTNRMQTELTTVESGGSLQTRLDLYASAYEYTLSNPATGAGLGSAQQVLSKVESSYNLVSVELGIFGLLLFVMLLVYLSRGVLNRDRGLNLGVYFILIVALGSFFDPVINFLETWMVLAVTLIWNRSLGEKSEKNQRTGQ